jgi:ComF family protein
MKTAGEPVHSRCVGCHAITADYKTCKSCSSWLKVSSVYVSTVYEGIYEDLIKSFKFDCKRQAAEPIAQIMNGLIVGLKSGYVLCPAPSRIRHRGFDHTKLIAKYLAGLTGLELNTNLKRKTNMRQLGSSRTKRLQQMEQEFYTSGVSSFKDKKVLLVDDVVTTGATLSGATKTLKDAGATKVDAVVFAQKL